MLKKLFQQKTASTSVQLFRYTFVGSFAFLFDFATLYLLTEFLKIDYLISAAIAFVVGTLVNYLLSLLWVFKESRLKSRSAEILIFTIIGLLGLGFNELLIWFFTAKVGFFYLISKIFSTVIIYLWNFFARKYLLFK